MMPINHPIRVGIRDTANYRAKVPTRGAPEAIGHSHFEKEYPFVKTRVTPTLYEFIVLDFLESIGVIDDKGVKDD